MEIILLSYLAVSVFKDSIILLKAFKMEKSFIFSKSFFPKEQKKN